MEEQIRTKSLPDVVNSIATFPLCIPAEDIIGELFVLFDGGIRLVVSWILKLLVNYDILQVVAYSRRGRARENEITDLFSEN